MGSGSDAAGARRGRSSCGVASASFQRSSHPAHQVLPRIFAVATGSAVLALPSRSALRNMQTYHRHRSSSARTALLPPEVENSAARFASRSTIQRGRSAWPTHGPNRQRQSSGVSAIWFGRPAQRARPPYHQAKAGALQTGYSAQRSSAAAERSESPVGVNVPSQWGTGGVRAGL